MLVTELIDWVGTVDVQTIEKEIKVIDELNVYGELSVGEKKVWALYRIFVN